MSKAFYMGKRLERGMPRHTMCDETGRSWFYPRAKDLHFSGAQIGHAYENQKSDGSEGFGLPDIWSKCDTGDVHPDREKWQAEHRLAIELKKQAATVPDAELKAHVDALREAVARMTQNQRVTFLAYLITTFTTWRPK